MEQYHLNPDSRIRMLDSEGRQKWLKVDDLLKEAGISRGMTCVDLGCGAGTLTFPLLLAVGEKGKVYSVDSDEKMIEYIKSKNPPSNLIPVISNADRTGLEDRTADICFMVLLLHEVEEPDSVMAEALRLLKPGGKALVLEWREDLDIPHPPVNERINRKRIEQLFEQAGFSGFEYTDWSRSHYIATGHKNQMD
jgi:ubiquinone/menaquinone biosynthesis C-methylase UbiE